MVPRRAKSSRPSFSTRIGSFGVAFGAPVSSATYHFVSPPGFFYILLVCLASLFSSFTTPVLSATFTLALFLIGHVSRDLVDFVFARFQSHQNYRGGRYVPGYWSMSNHVAFGILSGALPSGRRRGQPFTPGLTPSALAGAPHDGPAAHARHLADALLPAMRSLREACDFLERRTDERMWPFPSYHQLLFQ